MSAKWKPEEEGKHLRSFLVRIVRKSPVNIESDISPPRREYTHVLGFTMIGIVASAAGAALVIFGGKNGELAWFTQLLVAQIAMAAIYGFTRIAISGTDRQHKSQQTSGSGPDETLEI